MKVFIFDVCKGLFLYQIAVISRHLLALEQLLECVWRQMQEA